MYPLFVKYCKTEGKLFSKNYLYSLWYFYCTFCRQFWNLRFAGLIFFFSFFLMSLINKWDSSTVNICSCTTKFLFNEGMKNRRKSRSILVRISNIARKLILGSIKVEMSKVWSLYGRSYRSKSIRIRWNFFD